MYKAYVEELTDDIVLETERGFLSYQIQSDHIYMKDIYIAPEFRKTHEASRMVDQIVVIARGLGIKKLLGSIKPSNKTATMSMKAHLAYGFVLDSCVNDFILLRKDV